MTFGVHEPTTLGEAVDVLGYEGDAAAALAGGTDLLLRIRRGRRKYRLVVNIKRVPELRQLMVAEATGLSIGALTTFRALEVSPLVQTRYTAPADAARV